MITGKHVVLVLTRPEDMPAIRKIAAQSAEWLFRDGGELSLDSLEAVLLSAADGTCSRLWSAWRAGEIIGFASMNDIDPVSRSAEGRFLGLRADAGGIWVYADILHTMARFGFTKLNLNRLTVRNYEDHHAVNALYKKGGFVLEGTAREAVWRDGRYVGMNFWALLAAEWRASQDTTGKDDTATRS